VTCPAFPEPTITYFATTTRKTGIFCTRILHFLPSPRPEGYQQSEPANVADVGLGVRVSPPLPPDQQETLAQTIYARVNQSNDGTTKQLSLKNARKLVRTHTEKDIQFALQRLAHRTNLANPTGFFVTVLRSTARANVISYDQRLI